MPHIALLRRFLDEEVVYAFRHEATPRGRLAPAERLLDVLRVSTLEEPLARRLLPLAQVPADFRFLAHRLPTQELLQALLKRAPSSDVAVMLEKIASLSAKRS